VWKRVSSWAARNSFSAIAAISVGFRREVILDHLKAAW